MTAPAPRWAVAGLLALGLILHLAALPSRSLNTDEVYIPLAARTGNLTAAILNDVHPPLHPLLVAGLVRAGVPESGWRLLSVLCWLATAYFAWRLGRRLATDGVGFAALALLLTSPQGFAISQLVRSYALAAMLGAAAVCLLAAHLQRPQTRKALALGVVLALGCYTFYYHVFFAGAVGLAGLWLRRKDDPAGRGLLVAAVLAGALFTPWLLVLIGQIGALGGGWTNWSPAPHRLVRRVGQILAGAGGLDGIEPALRYAIPKVAGLTATAVTGAVFALGLYRLDKMRTPGKHTAVVLAATTGAGIALALAAHFLFGVFTALHYFVIFAAPLVVTIAASFALARLRFVAGALFGLVLVANLMAMPAAVRQGREPLRQATAWLDEQLNDNDVVLGLAWFAADGYRFYGAGHTVYGLPFDLRGERFPRRVQPGVLDNNDAARLRMLISGLDRIGLLLTHTTWRGEDRGEERLRYTLYTEGFIPERAKEWGMFTESPSVRTEMWRRLMPRYPFAPLPET